MLNTGWQELWANKTERWVAILSTAVVVIVVPIMSNFLSLVESRPGVIIADPIQAVFPPIELTWPIFFVLYGALLLAVVWLWKTPGILFQGFRAYAILLCLRMLCMWLIPLDPPPLMIILPDPIIQAVTNSTDAPLTRDLFFSGHTSSVFMTAFLMPTVSKRWTFMALGAIVGACLILQHVHYSIDVVVAPMAAMVAVALSGRPK